MKGRRYCFILLTTISLAPVIMWISILSVSPVHMTGTPQPQHIHKKEVTQRDVTIRYPSKTAHNNTILVNSTLADQTLKKVRVLCWITTQEKELKNKIPAVNQTWASRCDKRIYVMTRKQKTPPGPEIVDVGVPDGRGHLTEKTIAAFKHIHAHYVDDYDWFLKADDDTYIVMENLKHLLSQYDQNQGVYLGHLFKKYSKWGYMSGGAGYVLSRKAVEMLVRDGYNKNGTCKKAASDEDVELGHCLHAVGIPVHNTLDKYGKESFHPFSAYQHLTGHLPSALHEWERHPLRTGDDCCSQLPISFHYMDPKMMRTIDFLLYKTAVFGRSVDFSQLQDIYQPGVVPSLPPPVKKTPKPPQTNKAKKGT